MLVDALPTEMLKDFVNAVNAIQNGLEDHKRNNESQFNYKTKRKKQQLYVQSIL